MAQITTFTCDVCGRPKGEGNGWLRTCHMEVPARITFTHWDDNVVSSKQKHICSAQCAHSELDKFLSAINKVTQTTLSERIYCPQKIGATSND